MNIRELSLSIHLLAVEKGWWRDQLDEDDGDTLDIERVKAAVPEKLNLMHDEVSEASNEARQDLWDTYWEFSSERISLGALDELIKKSWKRDPAAREQLLRYVQLVGLDANEMAGLDQAEFKKNFLVALRKHKPEGFGIEVVDNIIRSIDLLHALGYDIEQLMELKHEYNKTRSYRHGGKRF